MKSTDIYKKFVFIFIILFIIIPIVSCATPEETGSVQPDYDTTKKMMVDMLQTEEGKSAIQEVLKEDDVKEELIMEQDFIKETIQLTLASEEGKEYWEEVMKDPEFSKTFAINMQEENEKLLKQLMKDPEYQGMMVDVLKDPEMEENYIELMKSKDYRQQVMAVVTEAMESPLFVARVSELLQQIAKEELQTLEDDDNGDDEQQENDDGNDEQEF